MSVIYQIQCKKCQCPLDFDVILDETADLLVDVEPCPDCIAKAIEEAAQAGEGGGAAAATEEIRQLRAKINRITTEIDCRIEHGAESGGHLEYVLKHLKAAQAGDVRS